MLFRSAPQPPAGRTVRLKVRFRLRDEAQRVPTRQGYKMQEGSIELPFTDSDVEFARWQASGYAEVGPAIPDLDQEPDAPAQGWLTFDRLPTPAQIRDRLEAIRRRLMSKVGS